jgi:hypothetical protein
MPQGSGRSNLPADLSGYLVAAFIEALVRAPAMTLEVFLHCEFGHNYIGCGFMGVVIIYMFAALFPEQNQGPLLWFATAYLVRWLFVSIRAVIRYWRGKELVHSRYNGRPYLWTLISSWKEVNVKHLESAAVLVLGFVVHSANRPLGDYLMVAATLLLVRGYHFDTQQRDRAVALNDSVIEQRMVAERFREMQEP